MGHQGDRPLQKSLPVDRDIDDSWGPLQGSLASCLRASGVRGTWDPRPQDTWVRISALVGVAEEDFAGLSLGGAAFSA